MSTLLQLLLVRFFPLLINTKTIVHPRSFRSLYELTLIAQNGSLNSLALINKNVPYSLLYIVHAVLNSSAVPTALYLHSGISGTPTWVKFG